MTVHLKKSGFGMEDNSPSDTPTSARPPQTKSPADPKPAASEPPGPKSPAPDSPAPDSPAPGSAPQPAAPESATSSIHLEEDVEIHTVRVAGYQLKRQIGTGGMGAVYEAVQSSPRRTVAVKLMLHPTGSRMNLRRFQRESQFLARLHHPGIAQVLEAGTYEHHGKQIPFYSMEFIPGARNICAYAREFHLSDRQILELFIRVCDAMHHAHTRGIIHRDLKPANILIDGTGQPKIIDFGVARAIDADQAPATLQTLGDQLLGTLPYMSPEQLDADPEALDARSDVYSLSVILYELLCGRLPYEISLSKIHQASQQIREAPPFPPGNVKPQFKGDIETILLRGLQKDRARRYHSADALAQDMRRHLDGEPILARSDSAAYRVRTRAQKLAWRHPVAAAGLAMLAALILAESVGNVIATAGTSDGYIRFLTTYMPAGTATRWKLAEVVVIAMQDSNDFAALAKSVGVPGVDPTNVFTLRRLHGALMQTLAKSGPRALAWDITFTPDSPENDPYLARGAKVLRDQGTAVVFAVDTWALNAARNGALTSALPPDSRNGCIQAQLQRDTPWIINLFVQHEFGEPVPSLVLAAVAAYWQPMVTPSFAYDSSLDDAIVRFTPSNQPSTRPATTLRDKYIDLAKVRALPADQIEHGVREGDRVGQFYVEVPATDALERSTIDYAKVFSMSPDQARAAFEGKLIFVGDLRLRRDGPFPHPDGRSLAGVYAHASAADAILAQDSLRTPPLVPIAGMRIQGRYIFDFLALCAGAAAAVLAGSRVPARVLAVTGLAVLTLVSSLLLYRVVRTIYVPLVPLLALIFAAELVAFVRRAAKPAI